MKREQLSNPGMPETKETLGRNVKIRAVFVRHGEKTLSTEHAETSLTPQGENQARDFGQNLGSVQTLKGYSSNTDRTIDTIKLATEASDAEKKLTFRIKDELGIKYKTDGEFSRTIHLKKKQILGDDFDSLSEKEKHNRLLAYETWSNDYYLSFKDKRPDPASESPMEVASKIALRVDLFIRMADRLHQGSEVTLLNGTHDYCMAAFLKEVLIKNTGDKSHAGFEKIEDIGGPIDFTESFEIQISTDKNGNKRVSLSFRGQEYSLDMQRLKELVTTGKTIMQEKRPWRKP